MITAPHIEPLAPPFEVETDEYRQAALDWVNYVRSELGREPLSDLRPADADYGEPNVASRCPVATSIREGNETVCAYARTMVGHHTLWAVTPLPVLAFMEEFDQGKYPDLRPGAS